MASADLADKRDIPIADAPDTLAIARQYIAAGMSVVPIRRDGSKVPPLKWEPYQHRLPTEDELHQWFGGRQPYGIATVGGAVSGCLEILDFDGQAETIFPAWCQRVEEQCPGLVARLSIARTPGGGYHVRYRCPDEDIPGNTNLALDPQAQGYERTLIQTRGEGGYALAPCSPADCHPSGRLYVHESGPAIPPTLTPEERETLWTCARSFTREVKELPRQVGLDLRPGEDFDRRGPDWAAILEPWGWRCVYGAPGGERRWRRPGKAQGWSATTGHCWGKDGGELLRVFTSNAPPFEEGKAYGKFRAWALLRHGGDLSAAAEELARQGYGSRHTRNGSPEGGAQIPNSYFPYIGGNKKYESAAAPVAFPRPVAWPDLKTAQEERRWLWHKCVERGSISLLSAYWKAGKTTLLKHLLKAMASGGNLCGLAVERAKVLYITEEPEARWAERRQEMGLGGEHVHFLLNPFLLQPQFPDWLRFIDYLRQLQQQNPADLIVIDTLTNTWPVKDENDASQVQRALMPLRTLLNPTALLAATHFRKSDGLEGTGTRGSGALLGFVNAIIEMRRFDEKRDTDRRRVLKWYTHWEGLPERVIELSADGQCYTAAGDRQGVVRQDLREGIRKLLPNKPPGLEAKEVHAAWVMVPRPGEMAIRAELARGAETDPPEWQREGEGKKGSPFTYWLPRANGRLKEAESLPLHAYIAPDADPAALQDPFSTNGDP